MAAGGKRNCPVCQEARADSYLRKGELTLVRCVRCGMIYADPAPDEMVSGVYYDQQGESFYLSPAKLEADYSPVRFEREVRLLRRHCSGGAILDVGCSSGAFLFHLKRAFGGDYDVLGTDVSGPPLDYAESRGVPVARGDFLTHEFHRPFDAITFWAVLEHLAAPARFLERAAALLNPGGLCFVLVPNMRSLAARTLGVRYRYIYPQHLNYFAARTLRLLVEQRFEVMEMRSMHFNPVILWQDLRRPLGEVPNAERAQLLARTTRLKSSRAMRPVKWVYGIVEQALGMAGLADNLAVVLRKQS